MKLPDIAMTRVLAITALLVCFQNTEAASGISKYIIGGREAVKGQFPWMVQLQTLSEGWYWWCGGSIIGSRWILTAAHCHHGTLPMAVYCGSILNGGKDAEFVVKQFDYFIKVHESFVRLELDDNHPYAKHDIALLKLSVSIRWSANIKPVKLPRRSQQHLHAGTRIVTSGFGVITAGDERRNIAPLDTKILRYMDFELGDDEVCQENFFLCSKLYRGRTTHEGDSGGPWVWVDPQGVSRLVGVTSANDIGDDGYNSNAVSVVNYLDWINHYTGIQIED